jgi:hypothetical protein
MTISAKKKFAIALSTLSLSLTITSCGAGLNAPTSKIRQVTDGAEADAGAIKVRHIMVVAQADGSGTLVGSIVNSAGEPDAIEVIGINYQVATYAGKKNLDVNSPVNFAGASANAQVSVPTLGAPIGSNVVIEIRFAKAGSIKVNALVRERSGELADVGGEFVAPTASPSPSATK